MMRFLRELRSNRDDVVALDGPAAARAALLRDGASTYAERMTGGETPTKLYLDAERYLDHEPSAEERAAFLAEVLRRCEAIVGALREKRGVEGATFVVAQRHGWDPRHRDHKLSLRPYFQGFAVPYSRIPALLRELVGAENVDDGLWDTKVYKAAEQMLGAIGQRKARDDPRRLMPLGVDDTAQLDVAAFEAFLAQHVPPDWPVIDVVGKPTPTTKKGATGGKAAKRWCGPPVERGGMGGSAPHSEASQLAAMLSPARADAYETWIHVGLCLHNVAPAELLDAWVAFSRKSPGKYREGECERLWADMGRRRREDGCGLGMGSLHLWAKEDAPAEYAAFRARDDVVGASNRGEVRIAPETAMQVARRALCALGLADADAQAEHARIAPDGTFMATLRGGGPLDGKVLSLDTRTLEARVAGADGGALASGFLHRSEALAVRQELAGVHKELRTGQSWSVTRPDEHVARFANGDQSAVIEFLNLHTPGAESAKLRVVDDDKVTRARITAKKDIATLHAAYASALRGHMQELGLAVAILGNNNNVCLNVNMPSAATGAEDRVRDEGAIAKAWLGFLDACTPDERGPATIAADGQRNFFFCERGRWSRGDKVFAANHLVSVMETAADGRFWKEDLAPEERRFVNTVRGCTAVLTRLVNAIKDDDFEKKLDANGDLLPFDNGVLDLATGEFRQTKWDDFVSTTVGYDFVPREAVREEDARFVETFYEQVLPVEEEREVFLRAAGAALSTDRQGDKFFVVATDKRDGNNGKSTALQGLEMVFGRFAVPSSSNFLYVCNNESANAHGANDLHYKGKRLAVFDETSSERPLNVEKIKRVTGGGLTLSVRGANDKVPTEFAWTALLFIGCNEGDIPRFDASASALLNRMVVVPFRAKFDDADHEAKERDTWPVDPDVRKKLHAARCAHLHLLLDAHRRYREDRGLVPRGGRLPEECLRWRGELAAATDPRLEAMNAFVAARVRFELERRPDQRGLRVLGVVKREDLVRAFKDWLREPEQADAGWGPELLKGAKSADLKRIACAAMLARGRRLAAEVNCAGGKVTNCFKDCRMVSAEEEEGVA